MDPERDHVQEVRRYIRDKRNYGYLQIMRNDFGGEPGLPFSMDALIVALGMRVYIWTPAEWGQGARLNLMRKINDIDGLEVVHMLLRVQGVHFDKLIV